MASVIIDDSSLKNIANAIRTRGRTLDTYKPYEMANAIKTMDLNTYFYSYNSDGTVDKLLYLSSETVGDTVTFYTYTRESE